jgi:hypothetical protein
VAVLFETRPELASEAPAVAKAIGRVFETKDFHPGLRKLVLALAPRLEGPERAALREKFLARARREAERSRRPRTGILFLSEGIFTRDLDQPNDPNASIPGAGHHLDVSIRANLDPGGPIPLVKDVVRGTFGSAQVKVQDGGIVTAIPQDSVHPVGMFADARAIVLTPVCRNGNGEVVHDDRGTPGEPADDAYTVSSVGSDIWMWGDSFTFASNKVAGDFVFTSHVAKRSKAPARWGKHGVMARQDITPWSRYSFLQDQQPVNNNHVDDLDQTRWSSRSTHGGDDNYETVVLAASEHHDWFRIERAGNVFKGYSSADGADGTWIQHGSEDWGPSAPPAVLVGLAVTSHTTDCGLPLTIQFDQVELVLKPGAALVPFENPDPVGIEVTWRDIRREKLKDGLHYTLEDVDPGTLRFGFGETGVTDLDPGTRWKSAALFRALGLQDLDVPNSILKGSR